MDSWRYSALNGVSHNALLSICYATVSRPKIFASPEIDVKCHIMPLWFYGPEIWSTIEKNLLEGLR